MPRPKRNSVALKSSTIENQATNNANNDVEMKDVDHNDKNGNGDVQELSNADFDPNSMDVSSVISGDETFKVGDKYMVKYKEQFCK